MRNLGIFLLLCGLAVADETVPYQEFNQRLDAAMASRDKEAIIEVLAQDPLNSSALFLAVAQQLETASGPERAGYLTVLNLIARVMLVKRGQADQTDFLRQRGRLVAQEKWKDTSLAEVGHPPEEGQPSLLAPGFSALDQELDAALARAVLAYEVGNFTESLAAARRVEQYVRDLRSTLKGQGLQDAGLQSALGELEAAEGAIRLANHERLGLALAVLEQGPARIVQVKTAIPDATERDRMEMNCQLAVALAARSLRRPEAFQAALGRVRELSQLLPVGEQQAFLVESLLFELAYLRDPERTPGEILGEQERVCRQTPQGSWQLNSDGLRMWNTLLVERATRYGEEDPGRLELENRRRAQREKLLATVRLDSAQLSAESDNPAEMMKRLTSRLQEGR